MFGSVFGYCINTTFVDAVRLSSFGICFYGNHEYMYIDAKPGALFGHVLVTLKSSGVSSERLDALGINLNWRRLNA